MPKSPRNYKEEYKEYHGKQEQIDNRSDRNKARRAAASEGKVTKGDGKEVDHKKPLSKGGSNSKANTRVVSRTENRKKYNKAK